MGQSLGPVLLNHDLRAPEPLIEACKVSAAFLPSAGVRDAKEDVGVWYEDFVPDITGLSGINEVARAGYLLEKLMTFHCVTRDVRLSITPTINELVREASSHIELLPVESILNVKQFSGDGLALRWRLGEDIHRQVQDLLPYQVRTYSHKRE